MQAWAYTRPLFSSTSALLARYVQRFHGVSVTKTALVELRTGRVSRWTRVNPGAYTCRLFGLS